MGLISNIALPFPQIAGGLAVVSVLAVSGCAIQTSRLKTERLRVSYLSAKIVDIAEVQKAQNARLIDWAKDFETKSKRIADNADKAFESGRAAAADAAERYILANRVRPSQGDSGTVRTPTPAESGSAGVPVELPADAVMVSALDVRACSAAADYALRAHEWALTVAE